MKRIISELEILAESFWICLPGPESVATFLASAPNELPGSITGITSASKLPPGAPGIALGSRLGARGQENHTETSLDPHEFVQALWVYPGARFQPCWLVPSAPFAEVIFEIVDSVASKRFFFRKERNTSQSVTAHPFPSAAENDVQLAFLPSKLYRFALCLFHDLPSRPVYLVAEAFKSSNYIEYAVAKFTARFWRSRNLVRDRFHCG